MRIARFLSQVCIIEVANREPAINVRFGSKADICNAQAHVC